jgi:hypothetical protein
LGIIDTGIEFFIEDGIPIDGIIAELNLKIKFITVECRSGFLPKFKVG